MVPFRIGIKHLEVLELRIPLDFEGGSKRKEEALSSWELALTGGKKDSTGTSPLRVEQSIYCGLDVWKR